MPAAATTPPEDDSSSLVPAILLVLGAIATYAGTKKAVGTAADVAKDLQIALKLQAALARIAQRALRRILDRTASAQAREQLTAVLEKAVDMAVADGTRTISEAARAIIQDRIADEREVKTRVSPRGEPFVPEDVSEDARTNAVDPDRLRKTARELASKTHQTVWNGAEYHAAEEAGWPRVQWRSQNDMRVRATHAVLDKQIVPIGTPFITYNGTTIRFPGDPLAPLEEVAGCRCYLKAVHTKGSSG